jgi:hypothetical protein
MPARRTPAHLEWLFMGVFLALLARGGERPAAESVARERASTGQAQARYNRDAIKDATGYIIIYY